MHRAHCTRNKLSAQHLYGCHLIHMLPQFIKQEERRHTIMIGLEAHNKHGNDTCMEPQALQVLFVPLVPEAASALSA